MDRIGGIQGIQGGQGEGVEEGDRKRMNG